MTSLDMEWADRIKNGVDGLIREVLRLESVGLALEKENADLKKRLELAEAVCEANEEYQKLLPDSWPRLKDAFENWQASKRKEG